MEPSRAAVCSAALGVSTRSWLGAVAATSGGLIVDHGWLRVLGRGRDKLASALPPPWTAEGKDLAEVSRRPIAMAELMSPHQELADQLTTGR